MLYIPIAFNLLAVRFVHMMPVLGGLDVYQVRIIDDFVYKIDCLPRECAKS